MLRKINPLWFFAFSLVTLVFSIFSYKAMSPWFWVFAASTLVFCLLGLGPLWIVKMALWFGTFWVCKLTVGPSGGMFGSVAAFIAATVVTQVFAKVIKTFRESRWQRQRQEQMAMMILKQNISAPRSDGKALQH